MYSQIIKGTIVRKFTLIDAREEFFKRGLIPVFEEYFDSTKPLKFTCVEKHLSQITLSNLRCERNIPCRVCVAREAFIKRGLTPLFTEYVNGYSNLPFFCNRGHHYQMSLHSVKKGHGCYICSQNKYTIEEVKKIFESKNWQLISEKYVGVESLLNFICDNKHSHQISLNSLLMGNGCGRCSIKRKYKLDEVKQLFEEKNYQLVSTDYKRNNQLLDFICDNGHAHKLTVNRLLSGQKCGVCFQLTVGNVSFPLYQIRSDISKRITIQVKKYDQTWRDFYNVKELLELAENIQTFCQSRLISQTIDHIIPVKWFDLTVKKELSACWNLDNLQYLSATENMQKGDRLTDRQLQYVIKNLGHILDNASNIPVDYLDKIHRYKKTLRYAKELEHVI
jgi:hypothetical protein